MTFRLSFPTELVAEEVAGLIQVLVAEPRGPWWSPAPPVTFETLLGPHSVSWWVSGEGSRLRHLQAAAEAVVPGIGWVEAMRPSIEVCQAAELRLEHGERLLAAELAEPAVRRLLGISASLGTGEAVLVQWLVGSWLHRAPIPASAPPVPRTIWNLPDWGTPSRTSEQVAALRKKQAEHLFAVVGRIAVAGTTGSRAQQLISSVVQSYQLLRAPGVGLRRRQLPSWWVQHQLRRPHVSTRSPAVRLTASELAAVIGWPVGNPALPTIRYRSSRRLPLDDRCLAAATTPNLRSLGLGGHPRQAAAVVQLPANEARRHLHVLGPSGVGKSTLLAHLILADITAGRGVVVIDPKGDLVTEVIERVPDVQRPRVVVLDPSDSAPVGFNPLRTTTLGIDGILHVLRSIWSSSWGPRLGDIVHAGLLTLSLSGRHSLAELPLLLTDASFRRPLVASALAKDPIGLGSFWPAFEALSEDGRAQVLAPVMNKLRAFLLRPELRAVLGQPEPRFDLNQVFTDRQVILVRLAKGEIGSEAAQLLGSLLVSHLWRLSLQRAALPPQARHPVSFVFDEFHEFLRLPVDLPDALVQARGLGIGLSLAHQHLGQLDSPVKSAVLANAASRVAFRLDYDDAVVLAKRSGGRLRPQDLTDLDAFEAYASLLAGDDITPYGSLRTQPLGPPLRPASQLQDESRQRWGIPAAETEARLRSLIAGTASGPPDLGPLGGRPGPGGGR